MRIRVQRRVTTETPDLDIRNRHEIEENVRYYADHPDRIEVRLRELDREWDVDRALSTDAALLTLSGVALSALGSRIGLLLAAAGAAVTVQYGVQRVNPVVGLLRRVGYRTREEIEEERYALRALRGDFDYVSSQVTDPGSRARMAITAVRE